MKFSGRERKSKGRVRLLRTRGSVELRKVASGSAAQGLWLRNGKVGFQVSAIDRSRFPRRRTVREIRRGGTRKKSQRWSKKESIQFLDLIWVKENSKSSAMPQPWPHRPKPISWEKNS